MLKNITNKPYPQTVIFPNNGILILRDKVTHNMIPAKIKNSTINPYIEFLKSLSLGSSIYIYNENPTIRITKLLITKNAISFPVIFVDICLNAPLVKFKFIDSHSNQFYYNIKFPRCK